MDSYVDVVFNKTFHGANESGYDEVEESRINHEAVLVPLVFIIILGLGLLGNCSLLYVVMKHHQLRTVPYMLIVNLAVADLLILVVCVPFTMTIYTYDSWQFGSFVCKLNEFLKTLVVSVSIFTLCALSIERYIILKGQLNSDASSNRRKVMVTVVIVWVLGACASLPDLVTAHVQDYYAGDIHVTICGPHPVTTPTYNKTITLLKFVYLFLLPLVCITIFYTLMAAKLCAPPEFSTPASYTQDTEKSLVDRVAKKGHIQTRRLHLARLVLLLVVLFVVCWLPRHIYLLWYHFSDDLYNAFWHYYKITSFCLTFCMSALNPVVIFVMDGLVNRYIKESLCCCCKTHNEEVELLEPDMELSVMMSTQQPSASLV